MMYVQAVVSELGLKFSTSRNSASDQLDTWSELRED